MTHAAGPRSSGGLLRNKKERRLLSTQWSESGLTTKAHWYWTCTEGDWTYIEGDWTYPEGDWTYTEGDWTNIEGDWTYTEGDCTCTEGH